MKPPNITPVSHNRRKWQVLERKRKAMKPPNTTSSGIFVGDGFSTGLLRDKSKIRFGPLNNNGDSVRRQNVLYIENVTH